MPISTFSLTSLLAVSVFGFNGLSYTVEPQWEEESLKVTLEVPEPEQKFTVPSWREGDYQLFQYGAAVRDVQFWRKGEPVPSRKLGASEWTIPGGADKAVYTVVASAGNFSPNLRVREAEAWVSGPVFAWLGDLKRPAQVTALHSEGMSLYSSLPVDEEKESSTFRAKDHQELMDSPFLLTSRAAESSFLVDGKMHTFVAFGSREGVDVKSFAGVAERVVLAAKELFGSLPYSRYVFFGDFRGGYGGLEHRASTRLGLNSTVADAGASLIAHEYFHAFNVKKIIPSEFVSLDFTKPVETDSLWWLEGVTDYYADVLLARAGLRTRDQALAEMSREIWSVERGGARKRVTLKEASRKVWLQRGSWGYGGLSYYQKGKVAGFALDLAIRQESGGAKSLDDVLLSLWEESKQGSGYSPTRIRELVKEHGGPESEALYVLVTETTEDIPWSKLVAPFGLILNEGRVILASERSEEQKKRWEAWPFSSKTGTERGQDQL